MTLAESTVANAIKWSIARWTCANIILAGPICSGKSILSRGIKQWFEILDYGKINVFDQSDFYKEFDALEDSKWGKDIDSLTSFEYEKFIASVKLMIENGFSYSPFFDKKNWSKKLNPFFGTSLTEAEEDALNKASENFILHTNERINIFTGLHAITLLKDVVPNPILIYVNTSFDVCMERRLKTETYAHVVKGDFVIHKNDYYNFVFDKVEQNILPQLDRADLVVKYE